MLLSQFPNIRWLKRQIQAQFQQKKGWNGSDLPFLGWPTVILNAQTSHVVRDDIEGPLSIFMNQSGKSTIGTQKQQTLLTPQTYLVTNDKEHYNLIINETQPTETFNLHFGTHFQQEAWHWFLHSHKTLLDAPQPYQQTLLHFPFKTAWRSPEFNLLVSQLKQAYVHQHSAEIKEQLLLSIFEQIILQNHSDRKQKEQLVALKTSTKEELLQRLYRAVDYIYAYYNQSISLEELAAVSCLSKYHFLRSFKQVFGLPPYQFIKKVRCQQAIHLLNTTRFPLQEIADEIGLENASSLSRMIFKQTGSYPKTFRS